MSDDNHSPHPHESSACPPKVDTFVEEFNNMDLRILQPYISVATACLDLVVNGTTRLKSPDLPRRITISIAIEHLGKCMRPNGPSFAKYDLMIMAQQTVE